MTKYDGECSEYDSSSVELGCRWHFAPQEGGREDGPNDAMMQNFKQSPYSALVREAVQNSLDAVLDTSQPVRIEICITSLKSRDYQNLFKLKEHIQECRKYFSWQQKAVELYSEMEKCFSSSRLGNTLCYIRISDYNTKGMEYDPHTSKSPFYAFARAAGVSAKIGQESGGSFGFGKSAYFQMSPIGTVFISSYSHTGRYAFEGVSWLCAHLFNGRKVCSVGYYDNNNGQPISKKENIPSRFLRKEFGTSFYILGFNEYYKMQAIKEMIAEAIKSFWLAIYFNHLTIKIDNCEINADNLDQYIRDVFPDEIDNTAKSNYLKPLPYYLAVKEANTSHKAQSFTEDLPILGQCTLYLLKASTPKDKIVYMRRPLMLVFGKRTQTSYGVFGTFVCRNPKGDKILQSLENPAHNEWKPSNWRDSDQRIVASGTDAMNEIHDFVMRCFASLFANSPDTALEITDLNELLYIPEDLIDDEKDADHDFGKPTGNVKEDGISLTTDILDQDGKQKDALDSSNVGSVKIVEFGSQDDSLVDDPDEPTCVVGIGGHKRKHSRRKGGKPTAGNTIVETQINDPNGTHKVYLPVHFRVVAQSEANKIYHLLIIHSERDVINGELELITIGEQTDDAVDIIASDNGIVRDNFLTGVVLEQGRNVIKIMFNDNMRHAIKLKAYENQ